VAVTCSDPCTLGVKRKKTRICLHLVRSQEGVFLCAILPPKIPGHSCLFYLRTPNFRNVRRAAYAIRVLSAKSFAVSFSSEPPPDSSKMGEELIQGRRDFLIALFFPAPPHRFRESVGRGGNPPDVCDHFLFIELTTAHKRPLRGLSPVPFCFSLSQVSFS